MRCGIKLWTDLNYQFLAIKRHLQEHDKEAKRQAQREQLRTVTQVQQDKLAKLTNKASQALDEVWD